MLVSLHRCPAFGCPRPHGLDQPVPRDRPGGVLHWPGQSLQLWWRWTHSKWCAKTPGRCQPRNQQGTALVFLWFGFDFCFSGVCRRGCKTFTQTRAVAPRWQTDCSGWLMQTHFWCKQPFDLTSLQSPQCVLPEHTFSLSCTDSAGPSVFFSCGLGSGLLLHQGNIETKQQLLKEKWHLNTGHSAK